MSHIHHSWSPSRLKWRTYSFRASIRCCPAMSSIFVPFKVFQSSNVGHTIESLLSDRVGAVDLPIFCKCCSTFSTSALVHMPWMWCSSCSLCNLCSKKIRYNARTCFRSIERLVPMLHENLKSSTRTFAVVNRYGLASSRIDLPLLVNSVWATLGFLAGRPGLLSLCFILYLAIRKMEWCW